MSRQCSSLLVLTSLKLYTCIHHYMRIRSHPYKFKGTSVLKFGTKMTFCMNFSDFTSHALTVAIFFSFFSIICSVS